VPGLGIVLESTCTLGDGCFLDDGDGRFLDMVRLSALFTFFQEILPMVLQRAHIIIRSRQLREYTDDQILELK